MSEKIYFRELQCYKNASEEVKMHKLYKPNKAFDLSQLPNISIRKEVSDFVQYRGAILTPLSINSELYPFNQLCRVLREELPELKSFKDIDEGQLARKAKIWLVKNGKNRTQRRIRTDTGKEVVIDADLLKYIRNIYRYLHPVEEKFEFDKDRWLIDLIPITLRTNPVRPVKSLNFKEIPQLRIRAETKKAVYIHLAQMALGTVMAEITAIKRFALFLNKYYPDVESLNDLDRVVFEQYLVWLNTEDTAKKDYSKELSNLRSILVTVGKLNDNQDLERLILREDLGKRKDVLYKTYSDDELKRLNKAIVYGDEQVARALFMHQLLGTRISEVLTLRQDSIIESTSGANCLVIKQIKTGRTYKKVINEEILSLFKRACEYTKEKYGAREYVFVDDKEPNRPMKYSKIQYHLMTMIRINDLRDDLGELFGVGTHIWRHNYGQRLTEMHVDDNTIAKLLGHANTSTLRSYRRLKSETLSAETQKTRREIDAQVRAVMGEWLVTKDNNAKLRQERENYGKSKENDSSESRQKS